MQHVANRLRGDDNYTNPGIIQLERVSFGLLLLSWLSLLRNTRERAKLEVLLLLLLVFVELQPSLMRLTSEALPMSKGRHLGRQTNQTRTS